MKKYECFLTKYDDLIVFDIEAENKTDAFEEAKAQVVK